MRRMPSYLPVNNTLPTPAEARNEAESLLARSIQGRMLAGYLVAVVLS